MHDMTAFERQVAGELVRRAGPALPVDDAAVLAAITISHSGKWTSPSAFSALKLVAAAAVVALFGAFLLATGLLQSPADHVTGAASHSPGPTSALLPGVDLVIEEVEPGVFRVLSDGTDNDMHLGARYGAGGTAQVVAGPDGSVWVRDVSEGEDRLIRLGSSGRHDASRVHDYSPDISVSPDGSVWALGDSANTWGSDSGADQLWSLDDSGWTAHVVPADVTVTGIETPVDGSVWTTWSVGTGRVKGCGGGYGRLAVARLVDGEWIEENVEPAAHAGDGGSLAIGPDGPNLLGTTYYNSCSGDAWVGVMERKEDGWVPSITFAQKANLRRLGIGPIAIGEDGTAWAWQPWARPRDHMNGPLTPRLQRLTGGDWEVFGDDGSMPILVGIQTFGSSVSVSADGRLWVALEGPSALDSNRESGKSIAATLDGPCAGVLSFDGTAWSHHLAGACASHVSAAPNGNVWVTVVDLDPGLAEDRAPGGAERLERPEEALPAGIYVITPAAVAGAEIVAP